MQVAITNPSMHMSRRMALVPMLVALLVQAAFANPQHPGMPRAQKHESPPRDRPARGGVAQCHSQGEHPWHEGFAG
jgi:hypothetical protein